MNDRDTSADNEPKSPEAPASPSAALPHQSRAGRWYRLATAAFVLAAVAVLGGSGWWLFDGRAIDGYALPDGAIPLGTHEVCAGTVTVSLKTDAEMTAVARTLRGDPRVLRSYTETQQEAYARFRRIFANQPQLLETTGADAMPASVIVVPKDQNATAGIAGQFRVQFPAARKVSDDNEVRSRFAGPGYRDPNCLPNGEHSR
ncbi:permease-like cell division protein FtsX [Amycolatopsis sp. FU40]|uniref:permease-like cell division protein FtsX n=1 Tax=Amycolatopsis sp. FU40 TaxID=2914159 RepID=UPI001F158BCD|nr:permease-like cell division protein FtsX [Amycolatopsis sp. FU40]UKD56776.1 permease-like cell division protein FtsX [Amycolatopsis sp. FU40]